MRRFDKELNKILDEIDDVFEDIKHSYYEEYIQNQSLEYIKIVNKSFKANLWNHIVKKFGNIITKRGSFYD